MADKDESTQSQEDMKDEIDLDSNVSDIEKDDVEEIIEEVVIEKTEVEILKEQLEEMEDKFLRTQAEMANMRNRFKKESESSTKYRSQDLAKSILSSVDNLERALSTEVATEEGTSMKKGIEMVLESVRNSLKEEHVEEIASLGETFDPNFHQAVQTVPKEDGQEVDEIVNVLQKGYVLYDRVLRPAMVIVAQ